MFSFNNPFGACPTCTGLGTQLKVDPELVIPNKSVSLLDGAICASGWNNVRGDGISRMYFEALSKKYHFSLRDPVEKLSKEVMDVILYGTKGEKLELQYDQPRGKGVLYQAFEGIIPNLERRYKETQSDGVREELESCMSECPCPACGGKRLRRESLAVTVGGLSISDYCEKSVVDALDFVDKLTLTEQQMRIGERILKEIKNAPRLPALGRTRISDALARERDALRRRGAAHPSRDADRLEPDGRALYPRRAVHRPAPARQRQAARHAQETARPWQHAHRRRARRGHDARGGLPHRHRPRRGRARRSGRGLRHAGRRSWRTRIP